MRLSYPLPVSCVGRPGAGRVPDSAQRVPPCSDSWPGSRVWRSTGRWREPLWGKVGQRRTRPDSGGNPGTGGSDASAGSGGCPSGQHSCDGGCVDDKAPTSCGLCACVHVRRYTGAANVFRPTRGLRRRPVRSMEAAGPVSINAEPSARTTRASIRAAPSAVPALPAPTEPLRATAPNASLKCNGTLQVVQRSVPGMLRGHRLPRPGQQHAQLHWRHVPVHAELHARKAMRERYRVPDLPN